jgi:hypothetical protein
VTLAGIDFTDLDNFADGFPHALFEVHRREAPVYWHPATENTPDGEGFWSVATYAETLAVLRDPETYSSVTGGSRPFGGTLLQDLSIAGQVLNMMDDPVSDVEVYLFFNLLFVPAQKPRETRSPVAYLRWPKIRTSSAFCGPTLRCCRRPSRRWSGGRRTVEAADRDSDRLAWRAVDRAGPEGVGVGGFGQP